MKKIFFYMLILFTLVGCKSATERIQQEIITEAKTTITTATELQEKLQEDQQCPNKTTYILEIEKIKSKLNIIIEKTNSTKTLHKKEIGQWKQRSSLLAGMLILIVFLFFKRK